MTENGTIDCTGTAYEVKKDIPIGVAHPIEMTKEQVEAWQKYFTSHNLKQPFVQIWEAAVDPDTIKEDRYKGCMIPFQFLRGQAKHGITVEDYDFHNEINVFLEDCDAYVERVTWKRHEINNDDLFEVTSFGFKKYTRKVNHIVAYLDRVTVYGRVLNNDSSIAEYLDYFTLAQIVEFINVAMENQSNDCLAILMDYKDKKFAEFDPMDMFTLD